MFVLFVLGITTSLYIRNQLLFAFLNNPLALKHVCSKSYMKCEWVIDKCDHKMYPLNLNSLSSMEEEEIDGDGTEKKKRKWK